ncbi:hypothetical protein O181_010387 [Austropuccinia psidii MF-1]|uniref:Uncharacterized protein n=1 Tax=Austropuccinia psidii MF-1 TaxID=1389203 RepID=A0A9Q3BTL9_9BASI|nr:hypothetical protein [Austropuccinia psidii MF-1]
MSEGSGSTPPISSKANPQSKFPHDFLLNPCWNPVSSQEPFGKIKQPTLNIPSGSQVHVGDEKCVDGGTKKDHWKMLLRVVCQREIWDLPFIKVILMMEYKLFHNLICLFHGLDMAPKGKTVLSQETIKDCDELYASLPLVHQEKVTGHHYPYPSKPRTAHSSS